MAWGSKRPLNWAKAPMALVFPDAGGTQLTMDAEHFSGPPPLVVGMVPGQHPEVLKTAVGLAQKLSAPLLCAFVDEASYLVEWDPARSAHRLSLHPDRDDDDIRSVTTELKSAIGCSHPRRRHGVDPAHPGRRSRAGDRQAGSEVNAPMIIVGTPERGFGHRISDS